MTILLDDYSYPYGLRTVAPQNVYEIVDVGTSPVSLSEARDYLLNPPTGDDTLIQLLIDAATSWGENYTSRSFRAQSFELLRDFFEPRMELRRDPVDAVTKVEYYLDDVLTTVDSSIYYLKKKAQFSELLLKDGESWPSDGDDREQLVKISFTTEAYNRPELIKEAILRHVAYLYMNRGDCADCDVSSAGKKSGATMIYNQFRISRV